MLLVHAEEGACVPLGYFEIEVADDPVEGLPVMGIIQDPVLIQDLEGWGYKKDAIIKQHTAVAVNYRPDLQIPAREEIQHPNPKSKQQAIWRWDQVFR